MNIDELNKVLQMTSAEATEIGNNPGAPLGMRLACQYLLKGDAQSKLCFFQTVLNIVFKVGS